MFFFSLGETCFGQICMNKIVSKLCVEKYVKNVHEWKNSFIKVAQAKFLNVETATKKSTGAKATVGDTVI